MAFARCDYIPWFETPTVSVPETARYTQGDVMCDVLTEDGRQCGGEHGVTRCRDYCDRAARDWQMRLLPIAFRMMRNEVASVYSPEMKTWVPATSKFSNAAAWRKLANQVVIEIIGYRGGTLIYHGTITVTPATREGLNMVEIGAGALSDGSLALIRNQLHKLTDADCILSAQDDRIAIRAPHGERVTVGRAVSLGTRMLLIDAIAQLNQPFTMVCRYTLPGVSSDGPFETDAGTVPSFRGVRFGGPSL